MKPSCVLALAATLLAAGAAQAQSTVKTKTKYANGTEIKTTGRLPAGGAVQRVETVSGINVYPKPNSNRILLSFTQQFTKPGTLTLTDYRDQVVYQQALDPATTTGAPVDLGHLPAGTYMVEAKSGNYVYWKQVRIKYPTRR